MCKERACGTLYRMIARHNRIILVVVYFSSKHEGLAGTRFGWGLYEDSQLSQRVASVIEALVLGLSIDAELRVLASLDAILGSHHNYNNYTLYSHHYAILTGGDGERRREEISRGYNLH